MFTSLAAGLLGIHTDLAETVALAARHGFDAVDTTANQLAGLSPAEKETVRQQLASTGLRTGYFGLDPVVLSVEDPAWTEGLETLRRAAPVAQELGYTRAIAVVMPFSETRAYAENTAFHLQHLNQVLPILNAHGITLGLEYVAPLTRRAAYPHHFLHTLEGALELISSAPHANVGLLLDSFHWFCASESTEQIRSLRPEQIVAVHLNDAVAGRSRDEQVAFERELPFASGEIDLHGFMTALKATGYNGPLTCEPMNKALGELDAETAAQQTASAMRRCLAVAL